MKNGAYGKTLLERFGFLPESVRGAIPGSIWLHAVSVGEVISAVRLVSRLRVTIPGCHIFVSVGTLAGRQIADQKLTGVADGVFYSPLDFVWCVRRVIRRLRPALVIVMETEIWPNLWRESKRSGAGLLVLNGRISDKAMPRYNTWRWFFAPVLLLADRILAQTEVSRQRYLSLGAAEGAVTIGGNLKYDFDAAGATPPAPVKEWVDQQPAGFVWVAASTMPPAREGDVDEDQTVLDTFRRISQNSPQLRLILVPRRPERFATAAAELEKRGIGYTRRSVLPSADSLPVLLLDSMGELAGVFRLADAVFVGGTLCERGGHNILEPAFFGKPVIIGPHMENFPEIAADFRSAEACMDVCDGAGLEAALRLLLADEVLRASLGEKARRVAVSKAGAISQAVDEAQRLYEYSLPRPFPSFLLAPLAALWRVGSRRKRKQDLSMARRLPRPVISVGGISVGGAGKTPFALRLAELLREAGRQPAFLSRGYRRISHDMCTVAQAGGPASVEVTGDEAQILVRSGVGPVGICANRTTAGLAVLKQFDPAVFVLDDGFQHARLSRDVDIVAIDTLDPFAGFNVIPAGRLREPLEALGRASAFVLMRSEAGRSYDGILEVLKRYNPSAPVWRARIEPTGWKDAATGETVDATRDRGGAFCGLGNPASFWRTLERLGLQPAFETAYPDHHRYHPRDLVHLSDRARHTGVSVLWTTEKDEMNLPPGWTQLHLSCQILSLQVRVAIEDEQAFVFWLLKELGRG